MSLIKGGSVFLSCLIGLPLAAYFLPGFHVASWANVFACAVVLGLFWAIIRPIVRILALPLNLITLGIIGFFIDAGLFYFILNRVPGIMVEGVGTAFLAALIVAVVQGLLGGRK